MLINVFKKLTLQQVYYKDKICIHSWWRCDSRWSCVCL